MKRLLLALLLVTGIGAPSAGDVVCEFDASAVKNMLRITNLCDGFVMWKTGKDEFAVVCPGTQPPAGAVELREFYNFKLYGS